MNDDRLLRLANRIHLLLLRELGQGIDVRRMLRDALYARDVLLVCEAHGADSDLCALAQHFRGERQAAERPAHASAIFSSSPPSATWSPGA